MEGREKSMGGREGGREESEEGRKGREGLMGGK